MKNELFRKEAVEKITGPEELDSYIKVLNPRVWLIVAGVAVALGGMVLFVASTGVPIFDLFFGNSGNSKSPQQKSSWLCKFIAPSSSKKFTSKSAFVSKSSFADDVRNGPDTNSTADKIKAIILRFTFLLNIIGSVIRLGLFLLMLRSPLPILQMLIFLI